MGDSESFEQIFGTGGFSLVMNSRSVFFHYKQGRTVLHRMPSVPKILIMLCLTIGAFYIPAIISAVLYVLLLILAFTYFKLTIKDVWSDNKPAFVYALFLYLVSFVSNIIFICKNGFLPETIKHPVLQIIQPEKIFFPMAIHLCLSLQITSLFFRSTTILQFTDGFASIEGFFTRKHRTPVADILSLTITFIPRIAAFWQRLCYAWKSRGGKKSVKKITKLAPLLFKNSMEEAYRKSLARMNRQA